ncbi:MAG: Ig-like domain-containing protein [Clostridiales Family XIII bacterium]|jgi:uncharacterized protein YjdB|nr:Ig-like domain-containing protein [Clostridiales Family XIII bacterium]
MNKMLSTRSGSSHTKALFIHSKTTRIILIAVTLLTAFLFFPSSTEYSIAATSLKIIQCKEVPDRPLKKFIYVGERLDFDVILNNEAKGAEGDRWAWKVSDTDKASIAANGRVQGLKTGTISVTVTYKGPDGNKSRSINLTIKQKVTSITLEDISLALETGDLSDVVVSRINPSNATDASNGVSFSSSNPSVVSVDSQGNIKALSSGVASVKVTFINKAVLTDTTGNAANEYITAACTVSVSDIHPTGVTLSKNSKGLYVGGTPFQLQAKVSPENATNKKVNWSSSDSTIATVDSAGRVTGKADGEAVITAVTVDGGKSATCDFTVIDFDLNSIEIDTDNINTYEGRKNVITATYVPEGSNAAWVVGDTSVATITVDGSQNSICTVSAISIGDTVITASSVYQGNPVQSVCTVHVRQVPLQGISMSTTTAILYVSDVLDIDATILPADVKNYSVEWDSSDTNVATVDSDGIVTALKSNMEKGTNEIIGDCTITVTVTGEDEDGNAVEFYDMCPLYVYDVLPQSISLDRTNLSMKTSDSPVALQATIYPPNTTNKEILFESDNDELAEVSDTGVVRPVSAGVTEIRAISAEDHSVKAVCRVEIKPEYSEDIRVVRDEVTVGIDYTTFIQVISAPGPLSFTSSDTTIATVDESGYIKGVKRGNTEIVISAHDDIKDRDVTKTIKVRVMKFVEKIIFDREEWILTAPGGSMPVGFTVLPEDADEKTLTWESTDSKIARVDKDGNIYPAGYGASVITAKATDGSSVDASFEVDIAIPATGIKLITDERNKTLYIDGAKRDSFTLQAKVLPDEASHREVIWTAEPSSAVALTPSGDNDEYCLITARGNSENIVVTASDYRSAKKVTFDVKVRTRISQIGLSLAPDKKFKDGDPINIVSSVVNKFKLNADIKPATATAEGLIWSSSDSNIKVDAFGNVTTAKNLKLGTYTITVKTPDGRVSAKQNIKVNQGVRGVYLSYNGDGNDDSLLMGSVRYYDVEVYPANAYNKTLILTSSSTEAISATYDSKTKRLKLTAAVDGFDFDGPTIIRLSATDGSEAYAELSLVVSAYQC